MEPCSETLLCKMPPPGGSSVPRKNPDTAPCGVQQSLWQSSKGKAEASVRFQAASFCSLSLGFDNGPSQYGQLPRPLKNLPHPVRPTLVEITAQRRDASRDPTEGLGLGRVLVKGTEALTKGLQKDFCMDHMKPVVFLALLFHWA